MAGPGYNGGALAPGVVNGVDSEGRALVTAPGERELATAPPDLRPPPPPPPSGWLAAVKKDDTVEALINDEWWPMRVVARASGDRLKVRSEAYPEEAPRTERAKRLRPRWKWTASKVECKRAY